jgi:hypothetical protein
MAEHQFIKPVCSKCGEDARPYAQFCFACGGEIVEGADTGEENVSAAWYKGDIVRTDAGSEQEVQGTSKGLSEVSEERAMIADKPDAIQSGLVRDDTEKGAKVKIKSKFEGDQKSKKESTFTPVKERLKSASEIRRQPKSVRTKKVEIVWEEKSGAPNFLFVTFGLLLFLLAVCIAFLAFYLK